MGFNRQGNIPNILVTGSSRSGTTWVGRMLALDPHLFYVYEPFNPDHIQPLCPLAIDQWFKHLDPKQKHPDYYRALSHVFRLKYSFRYNLPPKHGTSFLRRRLRSLSSIYHRLAGHSVLMKDPIALLSTEWLGKQFDPGIVIMIRHPAGFVGSLKHKGWTFDFQNFTMQPRLLENYLDPYADEIRRMARENEKRDVIDKGALLWKCLYHVVSDFQTKYPQWTFLRLEDIARRPLHHFKYLYDRFNLSFSDSIRSTIHNYTQAKQKQSPSDGIQRDSASVIHNWKRRLTQQEIDRIRHKTHPVADQFYTDKEW